MTTNQFNNITANQSILNGQPVIKNTRIPIYIILKTLSALKDFDKVCEQYPILSHQDIQNVLNFASNSINFYELSNKKEF